MNTRRLLVLVPSLLAAPAVAHACAVCGGGNPANRFAFFASTIALSLLPLGLFAGAFLWLRSRRSDHGRTEFDDREAVVPDGLPASGSASAVPPPSTST